MYMEDIRDYSVPVCKLKCSFTPNVMIGCICSFSDAVSIYRHFSVDGRRMSCVCSTGLCGPA